MTRLVSGCLVGAMAATLGARVQRDVDGGSTPASMRSAVVALAKALIAKLP